MGANAACELLNFLGLLESRDRDHEVAGFLDVVLELIGKRNQRFCVLESLFVFGLRDGILLRFAVWEARVVLVLVLVWRLGESPPV